MDGSGAGLETRLASTRPAEPGRHVPSPPPSSSGGRRGRLALHIDACVPGRPAAGATGRLGRWRRAAAGTHLAVSLAAGALAGIATAPALGWGTAGLLAWVVTATVFLAGTLPVWRLDAADTSWLAAREDGSRAVRDLTLLGISVGTVATVVLVIFRVHQNPPVRTALGVACLAASWLVLNTVFTLRYAGLYYTGRRAAWTSPGRRSGLSGLRLPRLHRRDDLPGVGHGAADDRPAGDGAPARCHVLRLRRGDRRGHRQRRRRPHHLGFPGVQWWKPLGWFSCGIGLSRSSSQSMAARTSRRNSSAMSWLNPLRTTIRSTARSSRFGGIVYAGTSQPRSRSLREKS